MCYSCFEMNHGGHDQVSWAHLRRHRKKKCIQFFCVQKSIIRGGASRGRQVWDLLSYVECRLLVGLISFLLASVVVYSVSPIMFSTIQLLVSQVNSTCMHIAIRIFRHSLLLVDTHFFSSFIKTLSHDSVWF